MPDAYHICSICVLGDIPSTQQFLEFCADSELPPPREICITGNNGTGKSTLLSNIREHFITADSGAPLDSPCPDSSQLIATRLLINGDTFYRVTAFSPSQNPTERTFSDTEPIREALHRMQSGQSTIADCIEAFFHSDDIETADLPRLASPLFFTAPGTQPQSDDSSNLTQKLNRSFADRRDQFLLFLAESSTQEKKVSEAIAEFRDNTPNPLEDLAALWNETLKSTAGIEFHSNTATFSFSGSDHAVDFNALSPALQSFLSRTGSLFLSINSGSTTPSVVLIDEPEWGLAQELSTKFIEIVESITSENNIQLILSTKTPGIAKSIQKADHIHLRIDADGTRTAGPPIEPEVEEAEPEPEQQKNESPPQRGNLAKLKRAIEATDDQDELANLVDELMSLRKL